MNVTLKDFQVSAVGDLYRRFRLAFAEVSDRGDRQAIVLASPTGSGKTLMATTLMERILDGDGQYAGLGNVSFVWLSDQPELNEQSRRKILASSSRFQVQHLVTIDNTFDRDRLDPGKVYFLNTQKLGRDRHLVTPGDERSHTIWETLTNTVQNDPTSLVLIIDEAHKGMGQRRSDVQLAATIVQKFIKGSPGELSPIPLIVGISATPERFATLVHDVDGIVVRNVTVDVAAVRESGLIKDRVLVLHPKVAVNADWTLLREAAKSWQTISEHWKTYGTAEGLVVPVRPILVIQVEDTSGKSVTATDLNRTLNIIHQVAGDFGDGQIVHCFEEKTPVVVNGTTINSVSPADIQDDERIRVVLFKLSLNTGWDCPRAEVMMSFRRALDFTSIAQLIGRMVRTPLARRVESDDTLNSVALYLPNYDRAAVTRVVETLTQAGDERIASDIEVSDEPPPDLVRVPDAGKAFELLEELPLYRARRLPPMSNVKRVVALGRYLAQDELHPEAAKEAKGLILQTLSDEADAQQLEAQFQAQVQGLAEVEITGIAFDITGSRSETDSKSVRLEDANIDQLFVACGRRLGEGLHLAYIKERTGDQPDASLAKRELLALLSQPAVWDRLEARCLDLVTTWLKRYQPAINRLTEDTRANYARIRRTALVPESIPLKLPLTIQGSATGDLWEHHVYADQKDNFRAAATGWEHSVLEILTGRPEIRWWLRNPPRKEWSFSVIYKDEQGDEANMFPDFLVVREEGTELVVDIVEPHRLDEGDAARKLVGLAEYADHHGNLFGKILVVAKTSDGVFRSVDLNDEVARVAAKAVATTQSVVRLFADYSVPLT